MENTLTKLLNSNSENKLNEHDKMIFKNIQKDLKGREVLFGAEERVGQSIEKLRQENIAER